MTDTEKRMAMLVKDYLGVELDDHPEGLSASFKSLKADSLDIVCLVVGVEEEWAIEISDDAMEGFGPDLPNGKTVADLVALVDAKVAGRVAA